MSNFFAKAFKLIVTPHELALWLNTHGFSWMFTDEFLIKCAFKKRMGYTPDLNNPVTFSEKLQWLKLHDRKPEYTTMVDKYAVKEYVSSIIGEEYVIPTLGVWDRFEDIDFNTLPNQFVLKATHDSGGLVICKDKSHLDYEKAKKNLNDSLKRDYYLYSREWPYKNVPRKIICEEFLSDESSEENGGLVDYKFYCFNGCVDCVQVCIDRASGDTKFYFFDKTWKLMKINIYGQAVSDDFTLPRPKKLAEMFDIARKLSKGHPYLRVDLYECNDKIYFGELTFSPLSGYNSDLLPEGNQYFGDLIDLSLVEKK